MLLSSSSFLVVRVYFLPVQWSGDETTREKEEEEESGQEVAGLAQPVVVAIVPFLIARRTGEGGPPYV